MFKADEHILRLYLKLEECQRQRLWMERLWHPENFNWAKRGAPPPMTETKRIRLEELSKLGFGEEHYQCMVRREAQTRRELEEAVELHPLWPHFEKLRPFGRYLCGAFIAAGGDITRCPSVSSFWKGMGLDVLPDGTVPRRIRGKKNVQRTMPALPHVTRIGEQIRQQINRTANTKLRLLYERERGKYDAKYPNRAKLFNFKAALRMAQKILYACAWEQWRLAYNLPAPWPYAFDILNHNPGGRITMRDLYDK